MSETDLFTINDSDVALPVHRPKTGESVFDCAKRLGLRALGRRDARRRVSAVIKSEGLSTFCQPVRAHFDAIVAMAAAQGVALAPADIEAAKIRETLATHEAAGGKLARALRLQAERSAALAAGAAAKTAKPRRAPSAWEAHEKRAEETRLAILALEDE